MFRIADLKVGQIINLLNKEDNSKFKNLVVVAVDGHSALLNNSECISLSNDDEERIIAFSYSSQFYALSARASEILGDQAVNLSINKIVLLEEWSKDIDGIVSLYLVKDSDQSYIVLARIGRNSAILREGDFLIVEGNPLCKVDKIYQIEYNPSAVIVLA